MKKLISLAILVFNIGLDTVFAISDINDKIYENALINVYSANIRAFPNLNSKIIKTLKKDSIIKYSKSSKNGFVEIIFLGKDKKEYFGYILEKFLKPIENSRSNWKLESKNLTFQNFKDSSSKPFLNIISYKNLEKNITKDLKQINYSYKRLSDYYNILLKLYLQDKEKAIDKDLRMNDDFVFDIKKIFFNIENYILYLKSIDRDVNIAGNGTYEGLIKNPKTCIIGYTNLNLGGLNAISGMMPIELNKLYGSELGLFFALVDNQVLEEKEVQECKKQIDIIYKDKDFIKKTLLKK